MVVGAKEKTIGVAWGPRGLAPTDWAFDIGVKPIVGGS